MPINENITLSKNNVLLESLSQYLEEPLSQIAQDQALWEFQHQDLFNQEIFKEKWFKKALRQKEEGKRIPFSIYVDSELVGSTSYYNFDLDNRSVNIGYTWTIQKFWGSPLNATIKFLLLKQAFENWNLMRVSFFVDQENIRSCNAMKKLGATQEGILRQHMIRPDGTIRNSVIFSIIDGEWPAIKKDLLTRIGTENL